MLPVCLRSSLNGERWQLQTRLMQQLTLPQSSGVIVLTGDADIATLWFNGGAAIAGDADAAARASGLAESARMATPPRSAAPYDGNP